MFHKRNLAEMNNFGENFYVKSVSRETSQYEYSVKLFLK